MTPRYRRTACRVWKFRPIDRNDRARILHLAEQLNVRTRLRGQHGGCLKDSGLQVLRALLFRFLDCRTGRLDPSIDTIAAAVGHCRQTVVTALGRLKAAGFIDWVQRVVLVDVDGHRRPHQTSNAYVIGKGHAPAGFMPSGWRDGPPAYKSNVRSASTSLDIHEAPPQLPEDTRLRSALQRLAAKLGWSDEQLRNAGFA
jgi:hypothetical protein